MIRLLAALLALSLLVSCQAAPAERLGDSRANPVPAGETWASDQGARILVFSADDPFEAWQYIVPSPLDRQRYVRVIVRIDNGSQDNLTVRRDDFRLVGKLGRMLSPTPVDARLELNAELVPGGSAPGGLLFLADKDDSNFVLIYSPKPDQRTYFALPSLE